MSTGYRRPTKWTFRQLALLAAAAYFTFLGGSLVTDLEFWPRVFHHLVVSAILAGWMISLWRRKVGIPVTPLDWPIAAVFLAYFVAAIFAVDPRLSFEGVWQTFVLVMFFYILVDMMRSRGPRTVFEPLFLAGGVVVFMALFEFASWYLGFSWWLPSARQSWLSVGGLSQPVPPYIYRLTYTLSIATFLAGYLALLMPVALAWAITTPTATNRRGLLLWLGGAGIALVLTFSRGGLLSLAVSMVLFVLLVLAGSEVWRERLRALSRDWRIRAAMVVLIVIMAGVAAYGLRGDPYGHGAGDKMRFDLFQSAWNIGLQHPITGVGPSGFGRAMRPFRDPTVTGDYFTSPHSIPLQLFAETGLLGVAAFGWLVISVALLAWRRWRGSEDHERVRIAGIAAALAGFSAQNLGDTLVNIPVLLPWVTFGVYLAAQMVPVFSTRRAGIRRAVQIAISAVIGISILGWVLSDVAQYHFNRSVLLAQRGDLTGALGEIEIATNSDPAMGYYAAEHAQYLGQLAADDPGSIKPALDAYNTSLQYENSYALMRSNHALVLEASGDLAAASDEAHTAVKLQPNDPRYQLAAARIDEALGKDNSALSAYRMALDLNPAWVASGYWDKSPLRQQARDDFAGSTGTGWTPDQLALLDPSCWAPSRLAQETTVAVEHLCEGSVALRIRDQPDAALPWLDRAIEADKTLAAAYLLRAEARMTLGDAALAEKDTRTALFLGDLHAYAVLGKLAEAAGDDVNAEKYFRLSPPVVIQAQGWDVAVYNRRGLITHLPLLDAPGPSRYDFEAWLALIDLYDRQGRNAEADTLRSAILRIDPYFSF